MSIIIIDDQDLSHVTYNGSWAKGGSSNENDGTTASSNVPGDSFNVTFTGSVISVFGTLDITSGGVLTNYSVDGSPPEQVNSTSGAGDTFRQQFWKSPTLPVGKHTMVVKMIKVNNDPSQPAEGTIWFDYFQIVDPTIRPPATSHKPSHVGVIVGSLVGGILALLCLILAWIFFERRKKKKKISAHVQPIYWTKNEIDSDDPARRIGPLHMQETTIEPFVQSMTESSVSTTNAGTPRKSRLMVQESGLSEGSSGTNGSIIGSLPSPPSSATSRSTVSSPILRSSGSSTNGKTQMYMTSRGSEVSTQRLVATVSSQHPVQHTDSGIRDVVETGATTMELPPVYSPA